MAPLREGSTELRSEIERAARQSRRTTAEAVLRTGVEERLRSLETQLEEVKNRLNGLLFFLAGTVLAQTLLGLLA